MKKRLFVSGLLVCFFCAAWAGDLSVLPASSDAASAAEGTVTAASDQVASDPSVSADSSATAASEMPSSAADAQSSADSPSSAGETQKPVAESAAPVPTETPAISDDTPAVPAGEKLLYYYPEPESLVVVPEAAKSATAESSAAKAAAAKNPVLAKPEAAQKPSTAAKQAATPASEKKPGVSEKAASLEKQPAKEESKSKADAEILPGIWESEHTAPSIPAVTATAAKASTAPSRTMEMVVGQSLEVWYPATGWVYLGDASAQNGLGYQTRTMDKNDTLFTFKALKEGNYILEFSRYDVLSDSFTSDSLAVAVASALSGSSKKDKVRAPDYRAAETASTQGSASATAPSATGSLSGTVSAASGMPSAGVSAMAQPSAASASADSPSIGAPAGTAADPLADTLEKAKKAVAAGDASTAIPLLDAFLASSSPSLDEGLYLRGQAYELNGANRNVKKALESYESLVASYPESVRWKDADARIRYIKQFYLRVR